MFEGELLVVSGLINQKYLWRKPALIGLPLDKGWPRFPDNHCVR